MFSWRTSEWIPWVSTLRFCFPRRDAMGMHPQIEFEAQIAMAYNRWLTEKVLSNRSSKILHIPAVQRSGSVRTHRGVQGRSCIVGFVRASQRGA